MQFSNEQHDLSSRIEYAKLRFKLIKLEEAKFIAYVKAFRLLRNKILDGKHADKELQYEAEDAEANSKFAATSDQALFTQVGKALSCWAALEEMLVCIASLLLTTDIKKAGVVMYYDHQFRRVVDHRIRAFFSRRPIRSTKA